MVKQTNCFIGETGKTVKTTESNFIRNVSFKVVEQNIDLTDITNPLFVDFIIIGNKQVISSASETMPMVSLCNID